MRREAEGQAEGACCRVRGSGVRRGRAGASGVRWVSGVMHGPGNDSRAEITHSRRNTRLGED